MRKYQMGDFSTKERMYYQDDMEMNGLFEDISRELGTGLTKAWQGITKSIPKMAEDAVSKLINGGKKDKKETAAPIPVSNVVIPAANPNNATFGFSTTGQIVRTGLAGAAAVGATILVAKNVLD
jgi:hypothetical protein